MMALCIVICLIILSPVLVTALDEIIKWLFKDMDYGE